MSETQELDPSAIIEEVIDAYGGVQRVQHRFGYKAPMAVYNWRSRGIPKALLADIVQDTGISLARLQKAVSLNKVA